MNWQQLTTENTLQDLIKVSETKKVLIFKHSTRCSISAMVLSRIERDWETTENNRIEPYYLDLIKYRSLSNEIAQKFGVQHESPQILVIENGKCVYHASHNAISYREIQRQLS
jgi:bacillithiol system protein YtxJ